MYLHRAPISITDGLCKGSAYAYPALGELVLGLTLIPADEQTFALSYKVSDSLYLNAKVTDMTEVGLPFERV